MFSVCTYKWTEAYM